MIEFERRDNLVDHVRFDPGGIVDSTTTPQRKGGLITLRYGRRHGIEITIWGELAYDIGRALNAYMWRRQDRASSTPTSQESQRCPNRYCEDGCGICQDRERAEDDFIVPDRRPFARAIFNILPNGDWTATLTVPQLDYSEQRDGFRDYQEALRWADEQCEVLNAAEAVRGHVT